MKKYQNSNYWIEFWNSNPILKNKNPQIQVGRSINKIPIDDKTWQLSLDFIENKLNLTANDHLLDLCAGNGLISVPFSKKCKHVTAVDISKELIKCIDCIKNPNITTFVADARGIDFHKSSFDKIILYFALQHFSNRETIFLLKKMYKWLKQNGIIFIGDIPDYQKMWIFIDSKEREKLYFNSICSQKPIIGTWYTKDFLVKLADYLHFSECSIIDQPSEFINSQYRFDIILKK